MKAALTLMLTACGLAVPCLANHDDSRWPVREQETIQKNFTLAGSPMRLVIDNVDGYIHMTGVSGSQVRMTAHKTIHAETDSDLEQAKKDVRLELTENPGEVSAFYDAPWRCKGEHNHGCYETERRHFYNVTYDFDVEVPRNARLVISTINNGDIRIEKTDGDFEVNGINGGISMTDVAGSGEVKTINGPVVVKFNRNPSAPSTFNTLNGQMDIYFQRGLSADLLFKTFNGQVYTDFDVAARAAPASAPEQRDGRFIFHSNQFVGGRVGKGGPELKFDAFNGNIRLHQEQ
jgi:hypothetical protein